MSKQMPAFRGIGFGGTGNVNACIWSRGRREDYEEWPWKLEVCYKLAQAVLFVEFFPFSQDIERGFEFAERTLRVQRIPAKGSGAAICKMMRESGFKTVSSE
eukprot:767162-Hanusia_phi.AAC.2